MSNDERARKVYCKLVGIKPASKQDRRTGWCKTCMDKYYKTDIDKLNAAEHKPSYVHYGVLYCASCIEKVIRK